MRTKAKNFNTFLLRAAFLLLLAVTTTLTAGATQYIKDLMLIGGSESEVNSLKTTYQNQGWTVINQNLNAGCSSSSDRIYLLCKYDTSSGANFGYVADLYISTASGTAPDTRTVNGRTFYLVPYDGGSHFEKKKGDLNSNAGGADIHLYYSKDDNNSKCLSTISFNTNSSGALGSDDNGWGTGYDLNKGCGSSSDFIYLHATTATATIYKVYINPGFSGGEPPRVMESINSSQVAASKAAAQNKQFYKDTDGSIGFMMDPTFTDGLTNGENIFCGWGHGNVTYHKLTSTTTSFTAQWAVPEYYVTVKDDAHGSQLEYKTATSLVTTTKAEAQNLQFYKDSDGSIGFMLAPDYTPFGTENFVFLGWGNNDTYHKLTKGTTTFSAVGWKYEHDTTYGGRTITGYYPVGNETTIYIPQTIEGIDVTDLSCELGGMPNLQTVCFYQDSKFKVIPLRFLYNCHNVKYICLADDNGAFIAYSLPKSVGQVLEWAFAGTAIELLRLPGVDNVYYGAFMNCKSLHSLDFNIQVHLRDKAFEGCSSLTNVSLPGGTDRIESDVFRDCNSLARLELKDNLRNIRNCFQGCTSFTDLYYDGTKAQWDEVGKDSDWDQGMPAGWKLHWRYIVTFNGNGHGTPPTAQRVWSNQSSKVEKPVFVSDDGKVCTKWFTDAACTKEWNFSTDMVLGDMTLYAGGWEEPMSIYDNAVNNLTDLNGQTKNLKLQGRTFYCDGDWNTICLPFTLLSLENTPLEGFTVMRLVDYNPYNGHVTGFEDGTLYLNFVEANSIYAGMPYIIKKTGDSNISNPIFVDVTINADEPTAVTSDDGKVSFVGSYSPVSLTAGDKTVLYLGSNNKLFYPSTNRTLNSCRALFQLNGIVAGDVAAPNSVSACVLNFGDSETTGILNVNVNENDNESDNYWYSLDGKKLSEKPTQKGVYIHNGKKMVIK